MANETPDTPKVSETELRESTADELPQEAKSPDVQGTSKMRKDELVREVARLRSSSDASEDRGQSTDGEPERAGRSLATTHHEVIRQWAEERGATPATVDGMETADGTGSNFFQLASSDREDA